jgi:hypothetical protein
VSSAQCSYCKNTPFNRNLNSPGWLVSVRSRKGILSFLRIDRLQIEFPLPPEPARNAAVALHELFGDKYGEMSAGIICSRDPTPPRRAQLGHILQMGG